MAGFWTARHYSRTTFRKHHGLSRRDSTWNRGAFQLQVRVDVLQVTQGALYPALHRLEQQGWIRSKWHTTETGREAKFYELTKAGRVQLEKELEQWQRLSNAVGLVIRMV